MNNLHTEMYIVILIEKVLQGGISTSVDPYLKGDDMKAASKQHKAMKAYAQQIGHYRMPFAWAAK